MTDKKADARSSSYGRPTPGSGRTSEILSDFERGTQIACPVLGAFFGLLLVIGAVI